VQVSPVPGIKVVATSPQEDLFGLTGCYAEQLRLCRTELAAQRTRAEEKAKIEQKKATRRARRRAKAKSNAGVFSKGFLDVPTRKSRKKRTKANLDLPDGSLKHGADGNQRSQQFVAGTPLKKVATSANTDLTTSGNKHLSSSAAVSLMTQGVRDMSPTRTGCIGQNLTEANGTTKAMTGLPKPPPRSQSTPLMTHSAGSEPTSMSLRESFGSSSASSVSSASSTAKTPPKLGLCQPVSPGSKRTSPDSTARCQKAGCRRKLKPVMALLGQCRCGGCFCAKHRSALQHNCTAERVDRHRSTLPRIVPQKLVNF